MSKVSVFNFILKHFLRNPLYLLGFVLVTVNSNLVKITIPSLLGQLVKLQCMNAELLLYLAISYLATEFVLYRFWEYLMDVVLAPKIARDVTNDGMEHLLKTSYAHHSNNMPADLVSKVSLLEKTHNVIEVVLFKLIAEPMAILFALIKICRVNSYVGALIVLWIASFTCCMIAMGRLSSKEFALKAASTYTSNLASRVDLLRNIFLVRIFSNFTREIDIVHDKTSQEAKLRSYVERTLFSVRAFMWLSFSLMHCATIYALYAQGLPFHLFVSINASLDAIKYPVARMLSEFSKVASELARIRVGLSIYDEPKIAEFPQEGQNTVDQSQHKADALLV